MLYIIVLVVVCVYYSTADSSSDIKYCGPADSNAAVITTIKPVIHSNTHTIADLAGQQLYCGTS